MPFEVEYIEPLYRERTAEHVKRVYESAASRGGKIVAHHTVNVIGNDSRLKEHIMIVAELPEPPVTI